MQRRAGLFWCAIALASCVDAVGPKGGQATLDGSVGGLPDALAFGRPEDAGFDEPSAPNDGATDDMDASRLHDASMQTDGGVPPIGRPQLHDAGASVSHPLDPFSLDCANLPANGSCEGGPNEVLLVTSLAGHVAMFDAYDGQYLGYFLHPKAFRSDSPSEYRTVTQGADQCLWSVSVGDGSKDHPSGIERWDAESTQVTTVMEPRDDGGPSRDFPPEAIAFTANYVYTASGGGLERWTLAGAFDRVVTEGVRRFLVLGDGSILFTDNHEHSVRKVPPRGGPSSPFILRKGEQGELQDLVPDHVAYAGQGMLLVSTTGAYDGLYDVALGTGEAVEVAGISHSDVVAPLRNGGVLWMPSRTGEEFAVTQPTLAGDFEIETVLASREMSGAREVGHACLSDAFLARHATRPAQNTCIAPPEGPSLLEENFNGDDDFVGIGDDRHYKAFYSTGNPAVTATLEVVPNEGDAGVFQGGGARALKIKGAVADTSLGVRADLPGEGPHRPSYVSFRVMIGPTPPFRSNPGMSNLQEGATGRMVYMGPGQSGQSGRWTQIELRNIDWNQRTYDVYVDCVRETEGRALPPVDQLDRLLLYNSASSRSSNPEDSVAWFDDIIIK